MRAGERAQRLAVEDARFSWVRFAGAVLQWAAQVWLLIGVVLVVQDLFEPPGGWRDVGIGLVWCFFLLAASVVQTGALLLGAQPSVAVTCWISTLAMYAVLATRALRTVGLTPFAAITVGVAHTIAIVWFAWQGRRARHRALHAAPGGAPMRR